MNYAIPNQKVFKTSKPLKQNKRSMRNIELNRFLESHQIIVSVDQDTMEAKTIFKNEE